MAHWIRMGGALVALVALGAVVTGCPPSGPPASAPTAGFSADPVDGFVPLDVTFADESEANGAEITAWAWEFGDGGTSAEQNPTHSYQLAGVYTVKLTVTNAEGSDTATKTDYITVEERRVEISVDSSIGANVTTGDDTFTATGKVLVLDGGPMPDELLWLVANDADAAKAANGTTPVAADGAFSVEVPLTAGDNQVSLRVPFTEIEASFVVTYNPGYAFGGQLSIWPDTAYVGEPREFTALVALPPVGEGEAAPEVMLVRLVEGDESDVAPMSDDGNLGNGDEIEGDGIYSAQFTLAEAEPNVAEFRVRVTSADASQARSEIFPVLVTERITEKRFDEITTQLAALEAKLEAAAATKSAKAVEEAIDEVLAALDEDPTVDQKGKSDGGQGVWLVYEDGIPAVLYAPTSDIKAGGGRGSAGAPTASPITEATEYPHYEHYFKAHTSSAQADFELRADPKNTIKSNKARVIAAQYFDWGDADDIPTMAKTLEDNGCFTVSYTKYGSKGSGSVEDFKNLGDYGLIFISSHGDSFFRFAIGSWVSTIFGWNGPSGQVVLHSNMAVTAANKVTYEDDLKKGRLVLWGSHYGMLPGFIRTYAGSLPNSWVHMSICRGTWNGTMASAFLDKGAGAFTGYDEYVSVAFCLSSAPPVLTELLKPDKTMEDAFTSGLKDPVAVGSALHPAEFKFFGAKTLCVDGSLKDGSFESNSITQAWSKAGDARIIPQLGASGPTDGSYMGIISTGLGFTTQSGTLSQEFCAGTAPLTISFDWNFFSEEFMEYVGSIYQDSFTVSLTDVKGGGTTVLVQETVDSLAGGVSKVDNSFDQGDVYATGWRSYSGSVPASLLGKRVRLEFYATDVGDSIYDTAVLIDNIKVEATPAK